MKKRSITSRILLAAWQSVIIILCVWYAVFVYYSDISPNRVAEKSFPQTTCHIVQSKLTEITHLVPLYRAEFLVKYQAQGPVYTRWAQGRGVAANFSTDKRAQQALLQQFAVNADFPCWYNPSVPNMVILVQNKNLSSSFRLFIPLIIAAIMGFYLIKNLLAGVLLLRAIRIARK